MKLATVSAHAGKHILSGGINVFFKKKFLSRNVSKHKKKKKTSMSAHEDHFSQKTHLSIIYFYHVFIPAYLYLSQTYNSKLPLVSVLHISAIGVWGRFLKNNC